MFLFLAVVFDSIDSICGLSIRMVRSLLFEKNEPAAFKNPLYAKISDWMMFRDILLFKVKLW